MPMRSLAVAALVLAAAASTATAATPAGAPRTIGTAQPAHHIDHPSSISEWWTLRMVDPRSRDWLEIRVERDFTETYVWLRGLHEDAGEIGANVRVDAPAATATRLDARGPDGAIAVRAGGRRITLSGKVRGTLRLRHAARGPAAMDWRLGESSGPGSIERRTITLNWAMLLATSTLAGRLQLDDGRRLRFRGWRASYEHGWGDMLEQDRNRDYWDQVVVHEPGGRARVAYGLNRLDTVTGPGARDAQWLGVLARAGGGTQQVCRPRVRRARWESAFSDVASWATRAAYACGGVRLRVRDGARLIDDRGTHYVIRSRTQRGVGFSFHLAHVQFSFN
jgi:hypothetical protein